MSLSGIAVVGGLALDLLVGELPTRLHPVAWFGEVVGHFDRDWARARLAGVLCAASLPLGAATLVGSLVWGAAGVDWRFGLAAGTLVVFVTTSLRSLVETVRRVSRLAGTDLQAARSELGALAGRDASELSPAAVRSAALESLAENLADGLLAPLAAFSTGALLARAGGAGPAVVLALACACAVWIKGVNTMDSMLGYPDRRLGTGAARLDDVAMWLPARLTALLLAAWFVDESALRRAADWQDSLASPNAGWPMGTLAAALDVRLEKPGYYVLNPAGRRPTVADVRLALGRAGLAGLSAYALAGVIAWS